MCVERAVNDDVDLPAVNDESNTDGPFRGELDSVQEQSLAGCSKRNYWECGERHATNSLTLYQKLRTALVPDLACPAAATGDALLRATKLAHR